MRVALVLVLAMAPAVDARGEEPRPAPGGVVVHVDVIGAPARADDAVAKPPAARREAVQILAERCALCHGAQGRGDGVLARTLSPAPRDLGSALWQRSVDDARIRRVILEGGAAVGLAATMPAAPELAQKPAVVDELVRLVRGFARRGLARAVLVPQGGGAAIAATAPLDASGAPLRLRFFGARPGGWSLRGFLDEDGDGTRDPDERAFSRASIQVGEAEARLEVRLDDDDAKGAAAEPAPAAASP